MRKPLRSATYNLPGNGPRSIKFNSRENLIKRRLIFPGQMDPWLNVTIGPNVLFVREGVQNTK